MNETMALTHHREKRHVTIWPAPKLRDSVKSHKASRVLKTEDRTPTGLVITCAAARLKIDIPKLISHSPSFFSKEAYSATRRCWMGMFQIMYGSFIIGCSVLSSSPNTSYGDMPAHTYGGRKKKHISIQTKRSRLSFGCASRISGELLACLLCIGSVDQNFRVGVTGRATASLPLGSLAKPTPGTVSNRYERASYRPTGRKFDAETTSLKNLYPCRLSSTVLIDSSVPLS